MKILQFLTSRMGVAMVKGLQGDGPLIDQDHIEATCKRFAGYGQVNGGRNFAPTNVTKRILYDQILPPFKAAVIEAKAQGVMPYHCEIDGVPCHANSELLTELLTESMWRSYPKRIGNFFKNTQAL